MEQQLAWSKAAMSGTWGQKLSSSLAAGSIGIYEIVILNNGTTHILVQDSKSLLPVLQEASQ